jgi:hypothetical protein
VAHLRAAGDPESFAAIFAGQSDAQRRAGVDDGRDFSVRLGAAVGARDDRAAVIADDHR